MNEEHTGSAMPSPDLQGLQAADFMPLLGQDFNIRFPGGAPAVAQLEEVVELPGYSPLERKPFSIILQTDQQTSYYLQSIYTIEHPALGPLPVFLVPVGKKGKGMQYEAVFS